MENTDGIDEIPRNYPYQITGENMYAYKKTLDPQCRMILKPDGSKYGNIKDYCYCDFVKNVADSSYWYQEADGKLHIEEPGQGLSL